MIDSMTITTKKTSSHQHLRVLPGYENRTLVPLTTIWAVIGVLLGVQVDPAPGTIDLGTWNTPLIGVWVIVSVYGALFLAANRLSD